MGPAYVHWAISQQLSASLRHAVSLALESLPMQCQRSASTNHCQSIHPLIVRTSHQRLYDMILSYGQDEVEVDKEKLPSYRFFRDPIEGAPRVAVPSGFTILALSISVAVTVILGILPQPVLDLIERAGVFLRVAGHHHRAALHDFQIFGAPAAEFGAGIDVHRREIGGKSDVAGEERTPVLLCRVGNRVVAFLAEHGAGTDAAELEDISVADEEVAAFRKKQAETRQVDYTVVNVSGREVGVERQRAGEVRCELVEHVDRRFDYLLFDAGGLIARAANAE